MRFSCKLRAGCEGIESPKLERLLIMIMIIIIISIFKVVREFDQLTPKLATPDLVSKKRLRIEATGT